MNTLFLSLLTLSSIIRTIHSFQDAAQDLAEASQDSLVLFDVDEVLISSTDLVLTPAGKSFNPPLLNDLTKEQSDELTSIMLAGTTYALVDPDGPKIIRTLHDRGVPAMGFTACWTGQLGVIASMENWRLHQLAEAGIDFRESQTISFPHLVDAKEHPPLFKTGVLFCGDFFDPIGSSKGKLLGHFLDRMNLKPSIVLFFDDRLKNIQAVEDELAKRDIPFKGFHFVAKWPALDEAVATLQIETALSQKKWLSDEKAKELLK